MWRWPVAVQFKITDKLTARAGSIFTRTKTKYEESSSSVTRVSEQYSVTNGAGVTTYGPEVQTISGTNSAYDYDANRSTAAYGYDTTRDSTEYRLGLGYQVSEHLAFDLMFSDDSNGRGADTEVIYFSGTLAF